MRDSIDIVYCGGPPKPDWCASLTKFEGKWNIDVSGSTFAIVTKLHATDKAKARALVICRALAATTFDGEGEPLGIEYLEVYDFTGKTQLAECEPPG